VRMTFSWLSGYHAGGFEKRMALMSFSLNTLNFWEF
jgi:hypothetical protein